QGGRAPGPGGPGGGGDLVRLPPRPVEIRFPGRVRLPGADGRGLLPDVAAPVLAAGVHRTAHPDREPQRRIRAGSVWIAAGYEDPAVFGAHLYGYGIWRAAADPCRTEPAWRIPVAWDRPVWALRSNCRLCEGLRPTARRCKAGGGSVGPDAREDRVRVGERRRNGQNEYQPAGRGPDELDRGTNGGTGLLLAGRRFEPQRLGLQRAGRDRFGRKRRP